MGEQPLELGVKWFSRDFYRELELDRSCFGAAISKVLMKGIPRRMVKPVLRFLTNEAGEKEGLGDAGIETFRDAPYASCAREAGQNSRDAATGLPAHPVRMSFNVLKLEHSSFPSYDVLSDTIAACSAEAEQDREIEFFSNASNVIGAKSIPVLEIADHNTTGLVGPANLEGTPFHSLVKASGVTSKGTVDSGGSFGIGKNASFAVSDLQTVFYATTYKDGDSQAFAAQGKVKLVSHTDSKGIKHRATGYWGDPDGFRAVTDRNLVPDWMRRSDTGTSIFCMGFRAAEDWAERMTYSLVSNFFCAVHREQMVFEVNDGKININRNTLEGLFSRQDIIDAAERTGHQADLTFAGQLHRCLVSDNSEEQTLTIPKLGNMKVRVLIEEGMPCRVGFIRNGMLITDNLRHFGHPLQQFRGSRDFIVVVEPDDLESGVLLKKLENPAHDGFSAERLPDATKRADAATAMKHLGRKLREVIKSTTGVKHEGSVVLDELGRFFAETGKAEKPDDPNAEHDPERYTYESQRRKSKSRKAPSPTGGELGGRSLNGTAASGKGGSSGSGTGRGNGGRGSGGEREPVVLREVRNLIRSDSSGAATSRELHFTPEVTGPIELILQATGVNTPEGLNLTAADAGSLGSGVLTIHAKKGERCNVTVSFDESYDGPIELIAVSPAETEETSV